MTATHQHVILYAEDDPDDLFIVQQAFEKFDDHVSLVYASNGFEALEKLKQQQQSNSLPCLIILDVNMPGMDGRESLIRIKQTEELSSIPVVLFTTSSSEGDKAFARKWGADFITKPLMFSELEDLAQRFINLCTSAVPHTVQP